MPFTDDDMKRLKEDLPNWKNRALDVPGLISKDELLNWLRIMTALLARLRAAELDRAELLEACKAVDIYFKALCEQWSANDGRLVSESGTVIEGGREVQRLCEIAGEKIGQVVKRLQEDDAWKKAAGK